MNEISAVELYDLYLDTIGRCTTDVCNLSDEEIEYNLFEEFDVGVHSFLHDDNLTKLRHAGFIDDEMFAVSQQVRARWLDLEKRSWSIEEVKTRKEWHDLFELCDRLKLKSRHA